MIKSALQSSLTNDVKYRSMSVGNLPSSEYLIQSILLDSTTGTVTFDTLTPFSSIYKHLQVVITARTSRSDPTDNLRLTFNSSSENYRAHYLLGNGSNVTSAMLATTSYIELVRAAGNTAPSGVFSALVVDILDPFNSNKNTTVRNFAGVTSANEVWLQSAAWFNTAPITQISFVQGFGNYLQGSRFSLYGVV